MDLKNFILSRPTIIFSRGASFEALPMASVLYMVRFDIQSARVDKKLQILVVMCCDAQPAG